MERPRIRHIAINAQDREAEATYYKSVFGLEEKERGPNGTIYLSDGHIGVAIINVPTPALWREPLRLPCGQR